MARTRRSIQPLNLYKYDVLIEEKGMRSDYFKITQFDGYFYGGRNAFLLAGSGVFRPNSKILVEILNKEGETVYSVPVSSYVEGNSRLIQVEVYSDTPIGPGKIVVMGSVDQYIDGTPVPDEWKGKYNVRWVSDVIISPLVQNKTPIRFQKTPSLFVNEKFYSSPSSSQFTETVTQPIDLEVSPKFYNVFPNGYILKLRNSSPTSFSSEFVGGKISGSITFSGSLGLETANIDLPITKIYNKNVAETEGNLIYTQRNTLITSIFLSSSATYSSSINSEYSTVVSSNINLIYSKLDTQATGSNISFTEVRIVDLETISGEIHKVRLSYKSATAPGEYVLLSEAGTGVRELFAIDSGSKVVNTGDFNKISIPEYWYSATMSLLPNEQVDSLPQYYYSSSLVNSSAIYKNNIDIIDGISATPTIVGANFIDNKSYFIGTSNLNFATVFPRSEYTLAFSAFASKVTGSQELSQSDYSMEVYLVSQEDSDSAILGTDPRGQFLGKLTPSSTFKKQNFERVEFNFVPKITKSGKYGLRFIVFGGHWSISNVSVKPSEEPFFSPDEVNLLVPLENQENDILTFLAEFYDVTNNSSGIDIFSIPTYITGSSNYVKKSGDYMTGELYINGLPMQQQALQDGFTGLVSGGVITVNAPASWSYTISSGSGYVVDNYTDPMNPTYTYVSWPQITKMPSAFVTTGSLASYPRTNIAISASGQVIEQSAEWTALDYRKYIILGRIAHVGTTSIQRALSLPLTTYNRGFHWFDLANAIGILNVEGNVYYASGSSMSIGKTAGKTYRVGSNYRNDTKFPDITTDPASLPTTFAYRYRSGSVFAETPLTTIISGNLYDDGSGTPHPVNPNKFTVQRIYYFGATNTTRIQFGQNVYDTLVDARSSADAEVFVADPNLDRDSSLRAYLIVGSSATDLSNATQAEFITIGKFGAGGTGGGGGGGGATALSGLTDVNLSGPSSGQLLQYNGSVWVNGTNVATLATTGSNTFVGNQIITGSLILSSSLPVELAVIGDTEITGSLRMFGGITGSIFGTSSRALSSSVATTSSYVVPSGLPLGTVSSSIQINTGSFSGSITTSSFSITSSFAQNYILPSGVVSSSQQINTGSFSGSITTASFAVSASWAPTVQSSPFPFTGSASISGSLLISGTVSNALNIVAASSPTINITGNTSPTFNIQGNGGTGSITVGSDVRLGSVTNIDLSFMQNNGIAWYINTSKHFSPAVNASYDLGLTSARIRTLWVTNISSSNPIPSASYVLPSGLPSNIVSSSAQAVALLPVGTVSSSAQVDHNTTTNYVANQHIDHTGVSIIAGTGLVGGGTIAASRTINALFIPSTDNRSVDNPPASASAGLYADFKTNTTDGLVDGGTYHGVLTFRPYGSTSDFSGGPAYQEGFTENGNLYLRSGSSNTWSSWRKLAYQTGSLFGTSSWAGSSSIAITASYALSAPGGGLTGGTTNYIPLWTGTGTLSSSAMFQSSSNIGIGTTTPSSSLMLNTSTGISHGLTMARSGWGSLFRLGAVSSSGDDFWITNNWNPQTNAQDSAEAGYITLAPKNELRAVINGTRMTTLNSTGLGIGTTSPASRLHVAGNNFFYTNTDFVASSAGSGLIITMGASSGNTYAQIYGFQAGNTAYSNLIIPGGNVGIGTVNPANSSKLDVADGKIRAGTLTSTNGATIIEGAYSNGAITILGSEYSSGGPVLGYGVTPSTASADSFFSSTGINATRGAYVIAGNIHKWSSAGTSTATIGTVVSLTEYMRLDASGRLGIGTNNPTQKLQVIGNAIIGANSNSSVAARLDITAGGSGFDSIIDLGFYDTFDAGVWYLKRHGADGTFRIANAGTGTEVPVLTINTSNNVGIGTSNPQTLLDITGSNPTARILGASGTTPKLTLSSAGVSAWSFRTSGSDSSFRLDQDGTDRITVANGGNVGIGTTVPDSALHIASPSTLNWKLQNTGAGGSTIASYAGVGTGSIGTLTNHAFFVYTNNSERIRVDIAGNVGIGTTTPNSALQVNGNVSASSYSGSGFVLGRAGLVMSGSDGVRHSSGSVEAVLRSNPTTNAVEFGSNTFHVVNMLINGSSLYQFGIGAFLATNPAYTLGSSVNPWATVYSSVYSSSISNAVGYFGTASYAVSASWAPSAGTVQSTTSGGPLNIYRAQTFGGF